MACFHPLEAAYNTDGTVLVLGAAAKRRFQSLRDRVFVIPCGKCVGCRDVRARAWAIRAMHESQMHRDNMFLTLTYNEKNVPLGLEYGHFQEFMRRFRRAISPVKVRFLMSGEYGELLRRPHFHALIFGYRFHDLVLYDGEELYTSKVADALWQRGSVKVGSVTFDSARYVAGYVCKKVNGPIAEIWNTRLDLSTGELVKVEAEFGGMSLKPGIGYNWFAKYWKEVFLARDGVCMKGGNVVPAPRFYMSKLEEFNAELADELKIKRQLNAKRFIEDCTPDRLLVREKCLRARNAFRRRTL